MTDECLGWPHVALHDKSWDSDIATTAPPTDLRVHQRTIGAPCQRVAIGGVERCPPVEGCGCPAPELSRWWRRKRPSPSPVMQLVWAITQLLICTAESTSPVSHVPQRVHAHEAAAGLTRSGPPASDTCCRRLRLLAFCTFRRALCNGPRSPSVAGGRRQVAGTAGLSRAPLANSAPRACGSGGGAHSSGRPASD